jgi:transcription-repair coupling factor (superfamily II helicase)
MYEKAKINPAKIPELISRMDGAMSFKHTEPVQFIYQIRNNRQTGNLLEMTGLVLDAMEILLEN